MEEAKKSKPEFPVLIKETKQVKAYKTEDVAKIVEKKPELPDYNVTRTNENADKLIILGFSPTSQQAAFEFEKKYPGCEIWCMNMFYVGGAGMFPFNHATRWFEFHHVPTNTSVNPNSPDGINHRQNLRGIPVPLYVQDKELYWKDFPNAVEFPADEIVKYFPRKYFSSTPSWLLAFAYLEGMKWKKETGKFKWSKVLMAGVDMMSGWNKKVMTDPVTGQQKVQDVIASEYAMQRPSVEWLCGFWDALKSQGTDCELIIPHESTILKLNGLYGFEEHFQEQAVINMKRDLETRNGWINERINNLQSNLNQLQQRYQQEAEAIQRQLATNIGAKQECELQLANFS